MIGDAILTDDFNQGVRYRAVNPVTVQISIRSRLRDALQVDGVIQLDAPQCPSVRAHISLGEEFEKKVAGTR